MNLWIAFFRGINVGGRNILPMKALRALLLDIGCADVSTYIQSGNVVFRHAATRPAALQEPIAEEIQRRFSFKPQVLLMTAEKLLAAQQGNPFPEAVNEPKTLHLSFLVSDAGAVDWNALNAAKSESERYELIDRVFYLHAPDGIGRSTLAANVEKYLGVAATARNWRTVTRVLELSEQSRT